MLNPQTASNPYKVVKHGDQKAYHALPILPFLKRHGYVFRTNKVFDATLRLTPNQGEHGMVEVQDIETGNRYWMMPGLVAQLSTSGQFKDGIARGRWTTRQTGQKYHLVKL